MFVIPGAIYFQSEILTLRRNISDKKLNDVSMTPNVLQNILLLKHYCAFYLAKLVCISHEAQEKYNIFMAVMYNIQLTVTFSG